MDKMLDWIRETKRPNLYLGIAILLSIPCYCFGIFVYRRGIASIDKQTGTATLTPSNQIENLLSPTFTNPAITKTITVTPTVTPTFTPTITYVLPDTETPSPSPSPTITNTYTSSPEPTETYTPSPSDTPTETFTPTPSETATDTLAHP